MKSDKGHPCHINLQMQSLIVFHTFAPQKGHKQIENE